MSNKVFGGPLLVIVLGAAAMLAYRFLPVGELIGRMGSGDEQATAEAPAPAAPVGVAPTPAPTQATVPSVAPAAKPPVRVPEVDASAEPAPKVSSPPAPVVAPALPNLRVFVQADVNERAELGGMTATHYAELLKSELAAVAADYLGGSAVQRGDGNLTFRAHLADGREGYERLCRQAQAQRVLLADVVIDAAGFSTVDSAYWPEVSFIAINCGDGRVHKSPKKRLEPSSSDSFGFQQHFHGRSQDFIARQGYFLKP